MRRLLVAAVALLALPATAQARLVTWDTTSRYVDASTVEFNGGDHPRRLRVNVWLPDGYDGKRRFPVLYLLHGHGDSYASWARPKNGDLARVAAKLGAVVVMPDGDRGWYANWWNGGRRAAPAWERYHLDELIPLVERRLRIRHGRRWHAIAGLSMGGEGGVYYATQRPGYFGSAASFSGPLSIQRPEWPAGFDTQGEDHRDVFGDPEAQRFYWTGHNPTALVDNLRHTRLFVAVGDGVPAPGEVTNGFGAVAELDLARHGEDFSAAARAAGLDVTFRPQQGIHDWPYWRRHLAQAIGWGLFRPVAPAPRDWDFSTVSQTGEAWGLRYRFAAPPEVVETLRRRGGKLTADGVGRLTLRDRDGCRFARQVPFAVKLPLPCAQIRLRVRPRVLRAGRRTRIRLRATAGRRPVAALVRVGSRRLRLGRRGRRTVQITPRRPGKLAIRATRPGLRPVTVLVRVRP